MTLGEKIAAWIEGAGLNPSEVARRAGTSRQNIENLIGGNVGQPRYLPALAKVIGVSLDELLDLRLQLPLPPKGGLHNGPVARYENTSYNAFPAAVEQKSVPLLSVPPLGHEVRESDAVKVAALGNVGPNGYALRVTGNSMLNPSGSPSFPDGCLIFVNPDLIAEPGKFVVGCLAGTTDFVFRKLIRESGKLYLEPLNPRFNIEPAPESLRLAGVVVSAAFDVF